MIQLETGAVFEGVGFALKSGTILQGQDATIRATGGPALYAPPGTSQIALSDVDCHSSLPNASPVQLGAADGSQRVLEAVPFNLTLTRVRVPSHRGKRGFGIHSRDTVLTDCSALDVWITGQDSQPYWIFNTPGNVKVIGGEWSAGSELAMLGGMAYVIPHCVPTNIEIAHGHYYRPKAWQTDLLDQEVKNGLEVKNGRQVHFHDLLIEHCWQEAQPLGAAFMLTPANGGEVVDVTIERCTLRDCADGVSMTGTDAAKINPTHTTGIVITDVDAKLTKGTSRGVFLMAQRFVGTIDVSNVLVDTDGTKFAEFVDQTERFTLTDSTARLGKYSLTFGGTHAATTADPFTPNVSELRIEGNQFIGSGANARFMSRFPSNRVITEAEFQGAWSGKRA